MPAVNPRLTITVPRTVAAAFAELSELTGNSQSSLIAELLEESLPLFENMIRVLRAAKTVRAESTEAFVAELDQAQARMEAHLGLALHTSSGDVDRFERLARGAAVPAQRERDGHGGSDPRPVTRGSTPPRGRSRKSGTAASSGKPNSPRSTGGRGSK